MISRRYHVVLGFVLFLCLPHPLVLGQDKRPAYLRIADEEDIRETVIRKQMEDWIAQGDDSEAKAKDGVEKKSKDV